MADAVETRYEYRITNPAGTYLGLLPNVKSDFTYNQEINTSFVEISVSVELSADVAPLLVTPLETESGQTITTEDNEPIYPERQPDVVSSTSSKAMIQNNNRVEVYEFSTWYPSGLLVFDGYINKWQASFGGTDIVTFTARSLADDMNDYILTSGNGTAEITQSTYNLDGYYVLRNNFIQQYFTPTASFLLKKIALQLRKNSSYNPTATIEIYSGTTLISTSTALITSLTFTEVEIILPTAIQLNVGVEYSMILRGDSQSVYYRVAYLTDPYPAGILRFWNGFSYQYLNTSDMYFILYSQTTLTDYSFNDATASEIAQAGMDNYISKGGLAYYDSTDTDNFPTQTEINDYTFKAATILEVQKKALSLSTDDIYYKVDPGSQLYFFGEVTSATNGVGTIHKLIFGKHFKQVEVGASVDEVRNVVSFTGGDVGAGVNLFTEYSDLDSIATQGRQRLERVVDNRVTIANTADSIAAAILAAKSEEKNFGTVEVLNNVYNTRLIEVGHAIQFKGIGNFLEDELYTVVSRSPTPESMRLTLGFIPNRMQDTIDQLIGDVQQIQTVDNPDAPS